jgi:hypothetical protein
MLVLASCARQQRTSLCTCCICFEQIEAGARSVTCSSDAHCICSGCLTGYAVAEATSNRQRIAANNGKLCCPGIGCSELFKHQEVAQVLPAKAYDGLLACMTQAAAQATVQAAAEQAKQERAREAAQDAVSKARSHIINNILMLKCPRCHKAFDEFDGCFAVRCTDTEGNGCGAAFCGYCLKDCGRDAHKHVGECADNADRSLFGTKETFQAAQRSRRERLVLQYLQTLPVSLQEQVKRATAQDLSDLGINLSNKQKQQQQALGQRTARYPAVEQHGVQPYDFYANNIETLSEGLCRVLIATAGAWIRGIIASRVLRWL